MDWKCKEKYFELALHQSLTDPRFQGFTWTTTARIFPSSRSLIPHGQLVVHLHGFSRHLTTLLYFRIAHPLGPCLILPSRLARSAPSSMFFQPLISRRSHSKIFILSQLTRRPRLVLLPSNLLTRQCYPNTYPSRPLPFPDLALSLEPH